MARVVIVRRVHRDRAFRGVDVVKPSLDLDVRLTVAPGEVVHQPASVLFRVLTVSTADVDSVVAVEEGL